MIKPFLISTLILLFVAYCRENGVKPLPPEETLCTITDTTSHDFSWRVDTLGLFPSSLHDVAAIDPNNVWAVGEIETVGYDSVWHNKTTRNNAVKWNGSKYEYYQLEVMDEGGNTSIQDLRFALTFSIDDIWFFSGSGSYIKWNGIAWESAFNHEQHGTPKAAWGTSSKNFFIVGSNGSIIHYDGNGFTLMESGTNKDLQDVTGYIDPETSRTNVWVAGELTLLHYAMA